MLSKKIKFSSDFSEFLPPPIPAKLNIPEEYKKMSNFYNDDKRNSTVKQCMPFLDSLTIGYIIPIPFDILFTYDPVKSIVDFNMSEILDPELSNLCGITSHQQHQISNNLRYNLRSIDNVFKFNNPWHIETPPGYSCIFTQPFNRNSSFKIIDGVVDTDVFKSRINFPFYWTDRTDQQTMLQREEPMVLIIPFKREDWKMKITKINKKTKKQAMVEGFPFIDRYKKMCFQKKSYR